MSIRRGSQCASTVRPSSRSTPRNCRWRSGTSSSDGHLMDSLLLLLLDSRSPAGAHGHSGGMEAAVTAGFVRDERDVQQFCAGRLATTGAVAAGFAAAAARAWQDGADALAWRDLDDEYSARTPSEAARASSRALGRGLLRLLRATVPARPGDDRRGDRAATSA